MITTDVVSHSRRVGDVITHISPLIVAANATAIAGRAYGWIALLLPIAPLVVAGVLRLVGPGAPRGLRSLVGFDIVVALAIGGSLVAIEAAKTWALLTYAFPFALLLLTLGVVNFVLITVSRAVRAWKGQQFDYPWVISPVARLVGLPPIWEE